MTWPNVNFDQRFVLFPMTKNGTARQVPVSLRMLEILRSLPRGASDNVWEGLSVFAVQHAFPTLAKNVGVENEHWHDLRHIGVTRLLSKGLHQQQISIVRSVRAVRNCVRALFALR